MWLASVGTLEDESMKPVIRTTTHGAEPTDVAMDGEEPIVPSLNLDQTPPLARFRNAASRRDRRPETHPRSGKFAWLPTRAKAAFIGNTRIVAIGVANHPGEVFYILHGK